MAVTRDILALSFALTLPLLHAQAQELKADFSLLDRPVRPIGDLGRRVPLTDALAYIGLNIKGSYALYGIEVLLKQGQQPKIELDLRQDSTVRTALDQIVRQLPDYRYEVAGAHLINVFPSSAKQDPSDLLNIRVPSFDVDAQPLAMLITHPEMFIPELDVRLRALSHIPPGTHLLGPGLGGGPPKISLHLRNVTVREIMNAVSATTERLGDTYSPLGWVYSFEQDKSDYHWTPHWSVPAAPPRP